MAKLCLQLCTSAAAASGVGHCTQKQCEVENLNICDYLPKRSKTCPTKHKLFARTTNPCQELRICSDTQNKSPEALHVRIYSMSYKQQISVIFTIVPQYLLCKVFLNSYGQYGWSNKFVIKDNNLV